ncbi:MAG: hypothetical protein DMF89_24670 [Acidobacteria bacterium]|nr:MAG: hypothetical protein DMF89_24670 [Acidobacteriota bacterium]
MKHNRIGLALTALRVGRNAQVSSLRALAGLLILCHPISAAAAELKTQTAEAFEQYVRIAEAQMSSRRGFLWPDDFREPEREHALASVRAGEPFISRVETRDNGQSLHVPDGLVHHWVGLVFAPGATLEQSLRLMQDYDHHAGLFRPAVTRSKLLARDNDVFRVHLRFFMKKVITVVVDTENEARFTRVAPDRASSRIRSLHVNEVEDPGTPRERTMPEGNDGGYLWRLNTYWRFLERDGGTYVQCESITLTRSIPFGLHWLIGPFLTSIPRESLTFVLETTRKALVTPPAL